MERHFEVGEVSELAAYCIGMAYVVHTNSSNRWNMILFLLIAAVLTWLIYRALNKRDAVRTKLKVR